MYLSLSLNTPLLSCSVVKEPAPLCISPFMAGRLLNYVRGGGAGAGWTMQRWGFWVCFDTSVLLFLLAPWLPKRRLQYLWWGCLTASLFHPRNPDCQSPQLTVDQFWQAGIQWTESTPAPRGSKMGSRAWEGGKRGRHRERERITLGVFRHETEDHQGMDLELVWSWICEFEFTSVELMWARSPRISTIVSNAVMDVRVQVSLWDPGFNSFKYIPGCGIAGSW